MKVQRSDGGMPIKVSYPKNMLTSCTMKMKALSFLHFASFCFEMNCINKSERNEKNEGFTPLFSQEEGDEDRLLGMGQRGANVNNVNEKIWEMNFPRTSERYRRL